MRARQLMQRLHRAQGAACIGLALAAGASCAHAATTAAPAEGLPEPLTAVAGDAARGRAIVASRQTGLCLLCHRAPIPEERLQGNISTDLAGAGLRWNAAQLRQRIVDARSLQPDSLMPAFHRIETDPPRRVAPAFRGKPILEAQQVEDVVAYLLSLREP